MNGLKMKDVYGNRGFDQMTPTQQFEYVELLRNVIISMYFEVRNMQKNAQENSEKILPQDLDEMIENLEKGIDTIAVARMCERDLEISDITDAQKWLT